MQTGILGNENEASGASILIGAAAVLAAPASPRFRHDETLVPE
jgi:hypothetical protein